MTTSGTSPVEAAPPQPAKTAGGDGFEPFGADGFGFDDLLDIVNPLQHIPIVSTLYRAISGDDIAAAPRLLGGTLFGGPIGLAAAAVNVVVDESSGMDIGEHVLALFDGDSDGSPAPTAVTEADDGPWAVPTAAEEAILAQEAAVFLPTAAEQAILAAESRATTATEAEKRILAQETKAQQGARTTTETPVALAGPAVAMPGQWMAFGATPDTAVTAQTIRDVKEEAADTRALEATAALNAAGPAKRPQPRPAPSGAAAADGGWFTDAMLTALDRYEKSALLVGTDGNSR